MNRFFLGTDQITNEKVTFPPDIAHQIRHVLRMKEQDRVAVLDNQGHLYNVSLRISPDHDQVAGDVVSVENVDTEPQTRVSLYFGLTSREKVEFILQKGTEIGVASFYPFVSSRTLVQSTALPDKKKARWERIIREAAEQSRRGMLPILQSPVGFEECLQQAKRDHLLCMIAWEEAAADRSTINQLVQMYTGDSIALFVGPEGGFSEKEINTARALDCQAVSLGKRILRMETAAIIFPALVLHDTGEF